jgi:hypothetical protein
MGFSVSSLWLLAGDTVNFSPVGFPAGSTFSWNFGAGALPSTSSDSAPRVVFTSAGARRVHLTATFQSPCISSPRDTSAQITVFDCNPAIPSNALIDSIASTSLSVLPDSAAIWVLPGTTLSLDGGHEGQVIYAEAGTTISGGIGKTIYLKSGASFNPGNGYGNIIIASPGAGFTGPVEYERILQCGSLDFDYSHAPHNNINSVTVDDAVSDLTVNIFPNPATNIVTIEASDIPLSFRLLNELGEEVLQHPDPITTKSLLFSVASLSAGNYYVDLYFQSGERMKKLIIQK